MGPKQTPLNFSGDIARYFQAQHADFNDDLPLYQKLAEQVGGPILELGCGTGRILLKIAEAGFEVVGVDKDLAMLQRLNSQTPPSLEQDIKIIQAQVESLPLEGAFPLVISPCSTLAYLPDPSFQRVLDELSNLISQDGRLVMDLPSPYQEPIDPIDGSIIEWFHEPERGSDVQVLAEQRKLGEAIVEVDWHYEEMSPDGVTSRRSFTTRYYLRTFAQLESMLAHAGLELIGAYGDYQQTPYRRDSPGLIIEAKPYN